MSAAALGKRKRSVIVKGKESAPAVQFGNAAQFREALRNEDAEAVKGALTGFRSQIAVQLDDHPLTATDPKVKLVADFLERSPGAEDIFDAWDVAINTNSQALLPLPLAVLSAIIALLAPLSFFHPLLAPVLTRLLSPTIARSVTQYITGSRSDLTIVALRVLVETARVGDRWAAKVWETVGAAHGGPQAKVWGKLFSMRRKEEKGQSPAQNPFTRPDIRTLSVSLFTTLLTSSHLPTKVGILAQPSLIHGTSKLLASDHPAVVQRVLQTWWEVWFKEKRIPRVTKLPAFTPEVIGDILKVYIGSDDDVLTKADDGYTAKSLAHHFLRSFLTIPGKGVCYQDNGWYPRNFHLDATAEELLEEAGKRQATTGGVHNKVLKEVLRGAGTLGLVGEDKKAEELVIEILRSCPELVAAYWSGSGITLDPRLSSKFLISSAHLSTIVSLPVPVDCFKLAPSLSSEPSSSAALATQYRFVPPPLASIVENVLPAIFPRHYSTNGLQSRHPLVRLTTATTLSRCLTKLRTVLDVFRQVARELEEGDGGQWNTRRKELEREMRQRVPDVTTVVDFATGASKAADSASADEAAQAAVLTESALRLLSLYQATLPGLIAEEARFDVGKLLLPSSSKGKGKGKEDPDSAAPGEDGWGFARSSLDGVAALSQLHVLRLLGEGGDFLWGARAGASSHTYMHHLLNLYLTTPHAETRATTAALASKLFGSSVLFEHDRDEVATWLASMLAFTRSPTLIDSADTAKLQTLLPFFDDCLKRSLKTPYKYLEESLEFDVGGATAPHHSELPSPLFVTLLEQLAAKIKAKLLQAHEVEVVGAFVGELALGLAAKQRTLGHATESARRIDAALEAAGFAASSLKGKLARELKALSAARIVAAEEAAALTEKASREKVLEVTNADLREISTWSRLSGAQLRQPLRALVSGEATANGTARAAPVDISDAMERLVRLLSDSKELSLDAVEAIQSLKSAVEAEPLGPSLNAGLAEPLFTVILEDHADSESALQLVCAMAPRTVMKPAIVVRHLQTLLATRVFANLSRFSPLRTPILLVIRALFDMSPATCCQPVHIEPLIPVYGGSMDVADRTLLSILHLFERHRRISVATLLATWSPEGPDAAGAIRRALDIVFALDPRRMLASCCDFPLRRSLDLQTEIASAQASFPGGDEIYDPVYVLSIFAMALAQSSLGGGYELTGLDWVEVLRSNVLGLAACALSSRMGDMRELGSFVLAKSFSIIKETDFQEQTQVLYTLYVLRHACPAPEAPSRTPHRAPTLITLFFAHTLRAIGTPSSFLYPATSRFLLQRPQIDAGDVPLLYGMLYSSDDEWKQERGWMIRFVRDGMQSAQDWRILQRRHTFSLFVSLFQSTQDAVAQRSIVEAVANMTRNATACASLVRREGLLPWLAIQLGATSAGGEDPSIGTETDAQAAVLDEASAKQVDKEVVWLRIAENVVVHAGHEDVARAARKPDVPLKAAWRGEVLGLLLKAVQSSSRLQVLHTAARILLRLSRLPSTSTDLTPSPCTVCTAIFTNLRTVEPSLARAVGTSTDVAQSGLWSAKNVYAPYSLTAEQAWSDIVANLWRVALSLGSDGKHAGGVSSATMEGLSGRVVVGGGALGRWVASELKIVFADAKNDNV